MNMREAGTGHVEKQENGVCGGGGGVDVKVSGYEGLPAEVGNLSEGL